MATNSPTKFTSPSRPTAMKHAISSVPRREWIFGSRRTAWTIAAITFLGTILRSQLLQTPVHADELDFFVHHYPQGWVFTVCVYYAANNHVAYNLILQALGAIFGPELWVARLPAFICGCLLIPLTARVVRQIAGTRPAIYAAALIAISPLFVNYSIYARGYSLFMLLIVASIGKLDRLIKHPTRRSAIQLGILWALAAWTIPIAIHSVSFLLLWAFVRIARDSTDVRRITIRTLTNACIVTGIATLLLYTPVLLVTGWRSLVSDPATTPRAFNQLPTQAIQQLSDLVWIMDRDFGMLGWVIPLVFTIVGAIVARRQSRPIIALAACALATQIVWLFIQRILPFPRALMPLIWILSALSAVGIAEMELRVRRVLRRGKSRDTHKLAITGTLVACAVMLFSRGQSEINGHWPHDFHRIAQTISNGQQQPRLFTNYADVGVSFYLLQIQIPTEINQFVGPGEYFLLSRKGTEGLDMVTRTAPGLDPVLAIWRSGGGPELQPSQIQEMGETRYYNLYRVNVSR